MTGGKFKMSDIYLIHSAKGSMWKKHKYVKKENGRYYYPKKNETETRDSLKSRQKQTRKKDLLVSKKEIPNETIVRDKKGNGYNLENEYVTDNLVRRRVTYDSEAQKLNDVQKKSDNKMAKSKDRAERKKASEERARKERNTKIMTKMSQVVANAKKAGKKAPTKPRNVTRANNGKKLVGGNSITNITTSKSKKPKLNNYKISTGPNQKGSTRGPMVDLSNVSKSKRKTQIGTSTPGVNSKKKATSSNAGRKKKKR